MTRAAQKSKISKFKQEASVLCLVGVSFVVYYLTGLVAYLANGINCEHRCSKFLPPNVLSPKADTCGLEVIAAFFSSVFSVAQSGTESSIVPFVCSRGYGKFSRARFTFQRYGFPGFVFSSALFGAKYFFKIWYSTFSPIEKFFALHTFPVVSLCYCIAGLRTKFFALFGSAECFFTLLTSVLHKAKHNTTTNYMQIVGL